MLRSWGLGLERIFVMIARITSAISTTIITCI